MPSWKPLKAMQFWNSDRPIVLFERPVQSLLRSEFRCSQVSGQLSGKKSGKSMQNALWTQKKHTYGVCLLHMHVSIYIHVCIYVRHRIWILAFNVKSTSDTAVLGRIFLQSDCNLLFTLFLQGRLEGLPTQSSRHFRCGAFMYLNTCTCTAPHVYCHALLLFLCLLKGAVSYIEKYLE